MLKKVRYTEPIYSGDELDLIEHINGAWLSDYSIDDINTNSRYDEQLRLENSLDLYQNANKEVHYDCNSLNPQLCFMPEWKEIKDDKLIQLTFSPPIRDFGFVGVWDFYNGNYNGDNAVENFPFGFIIGSSGDYCPSGWGGYGYAIGANGEKRLIGMGAGDNIYTWRYDNYHRQGNDDSFNIVLIGADMKFKGVLSFEKCPYPLYKMSFFGGYFYVINYDLWESKLAFIRNGKVLHSVEFTKGQDLKFIRTYRYDIAYTQNEFFFFNKMTEKLLVGKFASGFSDISFNPVLRSIATHKNGKFSIYRVFGKKIVTIAENSELLAFMLPYVADWNGNLKYDYMIKSDLNNPIINSYIKENNFRGHYLLMFNDVASDIQVGKLTGVNDLGYGDKSDFHINDFDDGDLGIKTHLPFRRTQLKTHDEIKFTQMSYTRAWKSGVRRIIFYTLNFDNEFGKLYVYSF